MDMDKKVFVLIGAAGYVAPKHMAAIKEVGGELAAALDPHDSVGVLDQYFPECQFFTEFERFDRFCENYLRRERPIDFVSICSPNYLHDAHCRFALRIGANAICEKPLTTHIKNLYGLIQDEKETGRKVFTMLQLRYHPEIVKLKKEVETGMHHVKVAYHTPRGAWYRYSWKGHISKSGGLAANIGIHAFDLMVHLFGHAIGMPQIDWADQERMSGTFSLERALVEWDLSISRAFAPRREFSVDGRTIDLTNGFHQLHTRAYQEILKGEGYGPEDAADAIAITESIRNQVYGERA